MDNLFKNMLPYEVILSIMGMIIFLALTFLLIWSVMKKRSFTKLLPFFIFPVIMVAYPTLKSITVGDFILDIQNQTKIVESNPSDTAASEKLSQSLVKLGSDSRLQNNSAALLAAANAQMVLGNYEPALTTLRKAEQINPDAVGLSSTRDQLNRKIEVRNTFINDISHLKLQMDNLKSSPGDNQALDQIQKTLSVIEVPQYVQPNDVLIIAKAFAISGNTQKSLQIINKVDSSSAKTNDGFSQLEDSIKNQTYQKQFVSPKTLSSVQPIAPHSDRELFNKVIIRKNQK